ncbi:MAG: DUF2600 family protein [Turicibacter sp.]
MGSFELLFNFYKTYQPVTKQRLKEFKNHAHTIPDSFLKKEALKSINGKTFHCYGASFYANLVQPEQVTSFLTFVTAYQTISDYLDNLIDQTTIINETNFLRLHQCMIDIFKLTPKLPNYYQYQVQQNDDGYLNHLVRQSQAVLKTIPQYEKYSSEFLRLAYLYIDLQVFKHLKVSQRELKLQAWHETNKHLAPDLSWYEFGAASGSTLGIFSLLAYAMNQTQYQVKPLEVYHSFFPSIQLLHIMLDYFIDLEEDITDKELNFFAYYESVDDGVSQLVEQYKQANISATKLPNRLFHHTINDGLFALYLAEGVIKSDEIKKYKKQILNQLNFRAKFLYHNAYFVLKRYRKEKG